MVYHDWIGRNVIAVDEWWGTYIGLMTNIVNLSIGDRALVQISKTLLQPSQYAIIFKDNPCPRDEYPAGSTKLFNVKNVTLLEGKMEAFGCCSSYMTSFLEMF